jgi:hypothetical protein
MMQDEDLRGDQQHPWRQFDYDRQGKQKNGAGDDAESGLEFQTRPSFKSHLPGAWPWSFLAANKASNKEAVSVRRGRGLSRMNDARLNAGACLQAKKAARNPFIARKRAPAIRRVHQQQRQRRSDAPRTTARQLASKDKRRS